LAWYFIISFGLVGVSQRGGSSTFTFRNELRTLKSIFTKACTILQVLGSNVVCFMLIWMFIIFVIIDKLGKIDNCVSIFNVNNV